ncbi:hypothetical protein ACIBO2_05595 [Nonomuraea sp. NPDC050022]
MADHDRDAGSRGEEEAPRDPTPGDPPRSDGFRDFFRLKPTPMPTKTG